jgi:hypothetical protein
MSVNTVNLQPKKFGKSVQDKDSDIFSSGRDEWMDFGSYVSGKTFGSKDLERQKDKKKAAKEEEDKIRSGLP